MATGNEKTFTSQERLTQLRVAESLYDAGLYKSALLIVSRKPTESFVELHIVTCLYPSRVIPLAQALFVCNPGCTANRVEFIFARSGKTKSGSRQMFYTGMPAV
jgi:hypothetical protein